MDIRIFPSEVSGDVSVPASKSVVHRALIASALSNGLTEITGVDFNEDIMATINVLQVLGAKIEIAADKIFVNGFDIHRQINSVSLNANESGSTLRFLIPLSSYKAKEVIFTGTNRLMERPQAVYKQIYSSQSLTFLEKQSHKYIKGKLSASNFKIRGDISSQFISGLLFILPLLENDSTIEVISPFQSKSYVDLTIAILKNHNIEIENKDNKYYIKAKQKYSTYNTIVEGDYSQAAFFAVLAAINNDLIIKNIDLNSVQGDKAILSILEKLNVKILYKDNQVKVLKSVISSGVVDLSDTPDLGPILCVLALFSTKYIKLENVKRLRIKESDRLLSMKNQLKKIGAKVEIETNSIKVYKLSRFTNKEIIVDGCNDHRVVMAMAILATVLNKPLVIQGANAVNKSYPKFFNDLNQLGVKTKWI